MKKIFIFFIVILSVAKDLNSQTYGGEIKAKNNAGTIGDIKRTNDGLKVSDSAMQALITTLNAKDFATQTTLSALNTKVPTLTLVGSALKVDNSAVTQPVSGTFWQATQPVSGTVTATIAAGATAIGKAEDVLSADADVGAGMLAVRKATPANTSSTDGDYEFLQMSAGRLWTSATIDAALPAGTNAIGKLAANSGVIIGDVNLVSAIPAGTNNIGDVDVLTVPSDPFGANADAASATGSISAKLRFIASTGIPITGTVTVGSHAVTNAGTFVTQPASATAPVSTMNSSSANAGLNAAVAGVFDDTSPTAITENSFGFIRMSANRNLYGTIRDAAGNERGANVNASNQLSVSVDNTVTVGSHAVTNAGVFAVQVDGSALTALQLIDDNMVAQSTALGTTKNALMAGSVTTAAPSYTTGNINPLSLTTAGALRVDNSAVTQPVSGTVSITSNSAVNVAQIGGTNTVTAGVSGMQAVGGNTATNVAITSNPLLLGAQGVSSENAAVTTGRGVQLVADLNGKLITLPYANSENFVSGAITTAMTATTSTSLIAAPASGLRNYITTIIVSNAHATVGTDIIIQDGSGGTTLMTIPAAAVYGGAVINLPVPLRQPSTATAIFCANVTTGASTKVSAVGYIGK